MPFPLPSRYTPEASIGAGGMGVVQLYRDQALDRDVAVKFTRRLDDINRVYDELRALQQLRSNHVVQLYDVIHKAQKGFEIALVQEYLPGSDLEDAGPLEGHELLLTLWQIASGLADVHGAGLIHRDIKPNNIKYGSDRYLKLFDFGLTRPTGSRANTVGFVGTDVYAAPELYAAGAVEFDQKIDMYSFGAIAWHLAVGDHPDCLTQQPPLFDASQIDFAANAPSLPLIISDLLQCCLQNDPASRPAAGNLRDVMAKHLLRDKHRALAVIGGKEYRLDATRRAVRIAVSAGDSIDIRYDGLDFGVSTTTGTVYVNNMAAYNGQILPRCCVIALGTMARPDERAYATFDVSQPEITI